MYSYRWTSLSSVSCVSSPGKLILYIVKYIQYFYIASKVTGNVCMCRTKAKNKNIKLFLNSIKSNETRNSYEILFQKFVDFIGENDLFCGNNSRLIEQKIIEFIILLRDSGKSYSAIRNYIVPIKSFYKINDIALNDKKISKFLPEQKRSGKG